MALEILIPNPAIRNLIREDKIHQIYSMMQTGQERYGMQTLNQSLASLYFQKQITIESALQRSANPEELEDLINRGSGVINFSGERATANTHAPANKITSEWRGLGSPAPPGTVNPFPAQPVAPPPTPGANPFTSPPATPGANPFGTPPGRR